MIIGCIGIYKNRWYKYMNCVHIGIIIVYVPQQVGSEHMIIEYTGIQENSAYTSTYCVHIRVLRPSYFGCRDMQSGGSNDTLRVDQ